MSPLHLKGLIRAIAALGVIFSNLPAQQTIITTSMVRLEIRHHPFTIVFKDHRGNTLAEGISPKERTPAIFGVKRNGRWDRITRLNRMTRDAGQHILEAFTETGELVGITITEKTALIHIEVKAAMNAEAVGYSFRAFPDEHFSGMGQRFTSLNLRGQEIPTHDQDWTVPIPFLMSSRGYGIYVETGGAFTFDMCSRDSSAFSFWVKQPSLDFHFIYGQTPKEIIKQYTALTGRMMKPPAWQFGVWKWRDWVFDESEVYQDATMLKSLDIPASVIFIDSPWSSEYIDYELNPKVFPNPKKFIDDLHLMGYRVLLWIVPFVNPAAKNFREADEKGYFVRDSSGKTYLIKWWTPSGTRELGLTVDDKGGMIDFTNPAAVKWWQSQLAKVIDLGVDGFKMDDGEHLPDDAHLFNGRRGDQMKSYPLLYCKAAYELMQEKRKGDFVLMPRAGWSGSQKYVPAFWAADQNADFDFRFGLPSVIRGGQSLGLAGFPFWGSDVGGYRWSPPKEVFARWLQFGAFSPIMEVGGKSYHEPWLFDDEIEQIFRHYAHLHAYLYDYISYYASEALREGTPIMRPLFLEFPDDNQAYQEEFEYMFGGELLVAPMYQPGHSRAIYLPKGNWMDFWSHEVMSGSKSISSYQAPLDKLPLFARVSRETVSRLYLPLFQQQVKGFEERINYVLRGEKKVLLTKPAERMRAQLNKFMQLVPQSSNHTNAQAFSDFEQATDTFKTFLKEEVKDGGVPHHIWQTLTERLDAIALSARANVTLNQYGH